MGFLSAPGPLELIVILVVALIFLGPSRLPGAARSVGKGMREFRESLAGIGDDPEDDPYDELDVSDEDEVEDVDPGAAPELDDVEPDEAEPELTPEPAAETKTESA